jgi:predicted nuclease of predicted toxin-antitoxin system
VKPLAYPLLTDENVHPVVVATLRERGKDVLTVIEAGLGGNADTVVLAWAVQVGRVVVTHDSDFGQLAVNAGEPSLGIIYLRPGHIDPAFTMQSIDVIETTAGSVQPGFILVAEHRRGQVRIRLRTPAGSPAW